MVKSEKTFNKILAVTAIGAGAYALLKGLSKGSEDAAAGEGSLGGTDDMYGEDYFDDKFDDNIGVQSIVDPNTIPEQPQAIDPYINPLPSQPTSPTVGNTSPSSPTTNDFGGAINPNSTTPDLAPANIFGDLTTPQVIGLGAASFLPSAFTSIGKLGVSQADDVGTSFLKRILPDAVEETPFVGKQLKDFAFKEADDVAVDLSQYGIKKFTGEVAEGVAEKGAKTLLKKGAVELGTLGVKSIPLVGIGAGVTLDIASNPNYKAMYDKGGLSRWTILGVAGVANALGDVVGGAAAAVTSPAALTGVGAVVPVAVGVGGQVATESAVYGIFNAVTGVNKPTPEQQAVLDKNSFVALKQAQNQGTIVPDSFYEDEYNSYQNLGFGGVDYNSNSVPSSVFSLSGGTKNKSSSSSNSRSSSSKYTPAAVISSSVANTSSPKLWTSSGGSSSSSSSRSSSSRSSSSSSSSSSKIDSSRFVSQGNGGYSDTVAKQSVSASVAASRSSSSSSYFGGGFSSSSKPKTTSSASKTSSSAAKVSYAAPKTSSSSNYFSSYSAPKSSSSSNKTSTKAAAKPAPKPAPKKTVISKIRSWFKR